MAGALLTRIVAYPEGYPCFLQEYGRAAWDAAQGSPITTTDVRETQATVESVPDQDFFSVRMAGLPDREVDCVRALASLGPGEHSQAAVAKVMARDGARELGSATPRLVDRGPIYKTKQGQVAFTVPQFDRYVVRTFG